MSLACFALRICAVNAVRDRTAAGDRVFDSSMSPENAMVASGRRPVIIVSSDDYRTTSEHETPSARDFLSPKTVNLSFETLIGSFVMVSDGNGGEFQIPHTDEGLELSINLIEREIVRALVAGDNEWSSLFMKFSPTLVEIASKRGAGSSDGHKFAARLTTISVATICDPPFGEAPDPASPWGRLVAALRADASLPGVGDLILGAIVGDPISANVAARISASMTSDEFAGIGFGPMVAIDPDNPVTIG
jgi:hypothetical protein